MRGSQNFSVEVKLALLIHHEMARDYNEARRAFGGCLPRVLRESSRAKLIRFSMSISLAPSLPLLKAMTATLVYTCQITGPRNDHTV
jgi:hypothetical protein